MAEPKGNQTKGEQLLEGLIGIVTEAAARVLEVDPELAKLLADEVTTRFSDQYGGELNYIPKGRIFRTSALHRQIWERFTGSNQGELAREFRLSVIHVYRVLAKERERDKAERQGQLPGLAG
jgi:Mor family transcriptional regulator